MLKISNLFKGSMLLSTMSGFLSTKELIPVSGYLYPDKFQVFLGGSDGKESACNTGDPSSITGLGKSPGEGNGNPLQCSYLGNSVDRGAWQSKVHGGHKESDMTE